MYNKSMGYIIEKMRGDSLTPLGNNKNPYYIDIEAYRKLPDKFKEDFKKRFMSGKPFYRGMWKRESLFNSKRVSTHIFFTKVPPGYEYAGDPYEYVVEVFKSNDKYNVFSIMFEVRDRITLDRYLFAGLYSDSTPSPSTDSLYVSRLEEATSLLERVFGIVIEE